MGQLMLMFILWRLGKKFVGWIDRYTIRIILIWMFVFIPFAILLFALDVSWHENWRRVLTFAVLWMPLRWDNQMNPMARQYSWAEKHEFQTGLSLQ